MVVEERTAVLRDHVELASEATEGAAVDGVGVRGAEDVGARCVDGGVDGEGGRVEEADGPGLWEDLARVGDEEEVGGLDEREVLALTASSSAIGCNAQTKSRNARMGSPRNNLS